MRRLFLALVAALAALAALGTAPAIRAAPAANAICPSFKLNGQKIQWEVIGTWTCKSAKPWVVKLDKNRMTAQLGRVPLHNGPTHYHCFGTQGANGKVVDGICYLGTLAFPKSGFSW